MSRAEPVPQSSTTQASLRWRLLRLAALLAGLGFLCWMLWTILRNPAVSLRVVSPAGFLAALIIGVAANAVIGTLFSDLVAKLAPAVPSRRRLASYYLSQLAKYIPGRVAALLIQSATLNTRRSMTITLVTNIELMAIAAWGCTAAAIACALLSSNPALAVIVGGIGALVAVWLIRIDWRPAMRLGWRITGRTFDGDSVAVSERPPLLRALFLALGSIVLPAATMFVLLAYGFPYGNERALSLTSALLLSWVGGSLAVIFPAGIGIREFLFIGIGHLIAPAPPAEQMAAIALLSRLLQVLTDLVGVLGFASLDFFRRSSALTH
jgi:hypothetical protein